MPRILKVRRPSDFMSYSGAECKHPLVGVIDYEKVSPVPHSLNNYEVYGLFIHSNIPDGLQYGCGGYESESGTLICVAPGQLGGMEDNGELIDLDGWALLFHPDLLKGTHLETGIRKFTFFDYHVNEALHLSDDERDIIASLMRHIQSEIERDSDLLQDRILVCYIDVLLNYCQRFYNRQFKNGATFHSDLLKRFNALLEEYFDKNLQIDSGLPTVRYFADKLNLSPNYFSDMVKRYTGDNAGDIIRNHIIRLSKNRLKASANVSQTAYSLGFEYPQHFSRMFKRQTGITPKQYLKKG